MSRLSIFLLLTLAVLVNSEQNTPIVVTTWNFVNATITGKLRHAKLPLLNIPWCNKKNTYKICKQ